MDIEGRLWDYNSRQFKTIMASEIQLSNKLGEMWVCSLWNSLATAHLFMDMKWEVRKLFFFKGKNIFHHWCMYWLVLKNFFYSINQLIKPERNRCNRSEWHALSGTPPLNPHVSSNYQLGGATSIDKRPVKELKQGTQSDFPFRKVTLD